eukprot:TRINITY_DN2651_c0_g1_i2.p1 TRINITY_DN2651_c0_g1~~TRINITY_DN2651_c0_g1_i2.p1  ORF type:complete len:226 (+),score=32.09 TRINITY_DN2651_c0_g1_i2:3-680(+)
MTRLFFTLILLHLVYSYPIVWYQSLSVGVNAGWGRFLYDTQSHQNLLTYTDYATALPSSCVPYFDDGPNVLVLSANQINGTYQQMSSIASPEGYIQEQSILFQIENSGTLLIAMRSRLPNCDWFGLPVVTSNDQGKTWTFLSYLDQTNSSDGQFNRGLWEPFLYQLPNGCIAGFYADETHADQGWNQIVGERVSCDDGKTWGDEIFAAALQDGLVTPLINFNELY